MRKPAQLDANMLNTTEKKKISFKENKWWKNVRNMQRMLKKLVPNVRNA